MHVTVRFFASLREAIGRDAIRLELTAATVAEVRRRLQGLLEPMQWEALGATGVQVAVNQAIVRGDVALQPGDEVAFLPPVTGG